MMLIHLPFGSYEIPLMHEVEKENVTKNLIIQNSPDYTFGLFAAACHSHEELYKMIHVGIPLVAGYVIFRDWKLQSVIALENLKRKQALNDLENMTPLSQEETDAFLKLAKENDF